ncbi:MAG: DMT family transporter [Planctomycetota bacterium]|jgi:transporter family-2 protein
MQSLPLILLMIAGGVCLAIQPSTNARMAQHVGLIGGAWMNFFVGLIILSCLGLTLGKADLTQVKNASWWQFAGGFFGAFFVSLGIFVVPKIGTTAALSAVIAGQLTTAVVLDHFGFFDLKQVAISPMRLAGIGLLVAGVFCIIYKPG